MFAFLIRYNFNASTILGLCSQKAAPCVFLVLTLFFFCALEYLSSGLNIPVFFESRNDVTREIMEYSHDGRGIKESKHLFVIQPLAPLPHVPTIPPSSFMSLYTPYFPMSPLRMPAQMALQQPALPVGAAGMGGFLALCPYHHPVSTGAQKCIGAQTEWRGTGAEPIWLPSCMVTAWQS